MGALARPAAALACAASGSSLDHRIVVLRASIYGPDPRPVHLNELSTTPNNTNGEPCFTITHPFHPLTDRTFPLLAQRFAWGEERVFFADPKTHEVRSLPLAWTSLALPDPFLVVANGRAVLRFRDLQQLVELLRDQQISGQEDH